MRKSLVIARMEYLTTIRSKAFIIIMLLAPVIMSGSGIAIKLLEDRVDTRDKKITIIDRSSLLAQHLKETADARNKNEIIDPETGKQVRPAYIVEIIQQDEEDPRSQKLKLSNEIRNGAGHAFIEIGEDVLHPRDNPEANRIAYYAKNSAMDDIRYWLERQINSQLRRLRMYEVGASDEEVNDVLSWLNVEALNLLSIDEETGEVKDASRANKAQAVLIPVILGIMLYMLILMGSVSQLQSVMEEKTQRIAEVMLGSVKPFDFMMGKLLGGLFIALTISFVYIIGGIAAVVYMGYEDFIPVASLPWFFAYLFFAIMMFGAINAALGSTCSEPKDAQSMTFPALIPVVFPLFIMFPVIQQPLTGFATGMSLFPLFTPILMTIRLSTPEGIPAWQPWVGLAGVIIFAIFSVWIGGRIFRVGILLQGTPPKLSNMIKWVIKG